MNHAATQAPELSTMGDMFSPDEDLDDGLSLTERDPSRLKRIAPGVFELTIVNHDFALIRVE